MREKSRPKDKEVRNEWDWPRPNQMTRYNIINELAKRIKAVDYLELGVWRGKTFGRVKIKNKTGVDPFPCPNRLRGCITHRISSDDFFEQNDKEFDIIFIDGLHLAEQVEKDIINSLKVLRPNGYIVCHDMLPTKEGHQSREGASVAAKHEDEYRVGLGEAGAWTGDCWKAWVKIRSERDDINMRVVDTDWGVGVISKEPQAKIDLNKDLTWENFLKERDYWMNIISPEEFIK